MPAIGLFKHPHPLVVLVGGNLKATPTGCYNQPPEGPFLCSIKVLKQNLKGKKKRPVGTYTNAHLSSVDYVPGFLPKGEPDPPLLITAFSDRQE